MRIQRSRVFVGIGALIVVFVAASVALFVATSWPLERVVAALGFLGITLIGITLASVAPEPGARMAEIGRALFVSGLLALAVWTVDELRRVQAAHESLRLTVGLQDNLSGIDLAGEDLSEFQLAGKDLSHADLVDAHLEGANLVGASLVGANLESADLGKADLENANLQGARLAEANLRTADLELADLRAANLFDADLTDAHLAGANLGDACLLRADLGLANLAGASLKRATLVDADLQHAAFEVDYRAAQLSGVGLAGANVEAAMWPRGFDVARHLEGAKRVRPPSPPRAAAADVVVGVSDGDTLLLKKQGPARLIGVDAPPPGTPTGDAATAFTRGLVPGGTRVLYLNGEDRSDEFGRRLVYVWLPDERFLNLVLVQRGEVTTLIGPSSSRYRRLLQRAELRAKQHTIGIWESCP